MGHAYLRMVKNYEHLYGTWKSFGNRTCKMPVAFAGISGIRSDRSGVLTYYRSLQEAEVELVMAK